MKSFLLNLQTFSLLIAFSFAWLNGPETLAKKPANPGNSGGNSGNSSGIVIGDPSGNTTEKYYFSSNINLSKTLHIEGPVIMVVDGDFSIGNNVVEFGNEGSLVLYLKGNMNISGNGGFNNQGKPINLQIYGTATSGHTLNITGNGVFSGVVYAPNANVISSGGGHAGSTSGSIVAKNITYNGSPGPFHFDESLKNLTLNGGFDVRKFILLDGNSLVTANGKTQPVIDFITETVANGKK